MAGGSPPLRFSYVDTDGDTVCLSSEGDVGELLARMPAPPLRLVACSSSKETTAQGPHNERTLSVLNAHDKKAVQEVPATLSCCGEVETEGLDGGARAHHRRNSRHCQRADG